MVGPKREVTLVLCTRQGRLLGALPPFDVPSPWWPEVAEVVRGARAVYGVDVIVLRLLAAAEATPAAGGAVTYLAQVTGAPAHELQPWDGNPLAETLHRLSYARPGGPNEDLAWADAVLAERGQPRTGPPEQVRTWNLSSLWRLPTALGWTWLKVVPRFFAHEGTMLARLDPSVVPPLIATAGSRSLLDHLPGEDRYDAPVDELARMVGILVGLQREWIGRESDLLGLGLPDWRADRLDAAALDVINRRSADLDDTTRSALDNLTSALPERWAAIDACGIPDTLVHGDFHPGNVRGTGEHLVLLDWGDCGFGHPLLDDTAFTERLSADDRATVRAEWRRQWQLAAPGSDPSRAVEQLAPIAALRHAAIYQGFLDRIEQTERIYHAADPDFWLRRAAALSARSHRIPK